MRLLSTLLATFSLLSTFARSDARACTCVEMDASAAADAADVIFEAGVVAPEDSDGRVRMRVTQYWKREIPVDIAIDPGEGSCRRTFVGDAHYVVYARFEDERLVAHLCDRVVLADRAEEDRALLGVGIVPVDPRATPPPHAETEDEARAQRAGCQSCAALGKGGAPRGLLWALGVFFLVFGSRRRRHRKANSLSGGRRRR